MKSIIKTVSATSTKVILEVKPAFQITAAQNRESILKATEAYNLPFEALTGNTFPVKGLIWTNGGKWDKETQCWMVPAQQREEVQAIVDKVSAKVEAAKAAHKAKKLETAA